MSKSEHILEEEIDIYDNEETERQVERIIKHHPILKVQTMTEPEKNKYMDVYLNMTMNTAQWRLISLACFIVLMVSVLGNVYLSTSVRVQPFVVQVDEHGYAIPIEPADATNLDYRIIAAQIGQFIFNMRTRVLDRAAQVYFAETSYKSVSEHSPALNTLNEYFAVNVPTAVKEGTVVHITAILPISDSTFQAEWTEKTGRNPERGYQGTFEITISPPDDMTNLINNPLGVYIRDFRVQEKIS